MSVGAVTPPVADVNGLSSVCDMSSPEASKVGAFGHAVSPLNR